MLKFKFRSNHTASSLSIISVYLLYFYHISHGTHLAKKAQDLFGSGIHDFLS